MEIAVSRLLKAETIVQDLLNGSKIAGEASLTCRG